MQRAGGKPQVVLSGFFGRGNCGDEALLQTQYEWLSPHYDVVISVDERGAYDGFGTGIPTTAAGSCTRRTSPSSPRTM